MGRKSYAQDLRERAIASYQAGHSQCWVATTFQVSVSTLKRWLTRYRQEGHVRPRERGHRPSVLDEAARHALDSQVSAHREASMAEYVELWTARTGQVVSVSTLWRAIRRLGWTRKKRQWVHASRMW